MAELADRDTQGRGWRSALALLVWLGGWALVLGFQARLDLANEALILVAAGALSAVWLPVWGALGLGLVGMVAFNWRFVPPRDTLQVDSTQNLGLLLGMLAITVEVSLLLAAQRRQAGLARRQAQDAEALRAWSDRLRESPDPQALLPELVHRLETAVDAPVALLAWREAPRWPLEEAALQTLGAPVDEEAGAALRHTLAEGRPMGPGTGYHDGLGFWVLPMRGTGVAQGAVAVFGQAVEGDGQALRQHLQSLCDLWGAARQRARAEADEQAAREREQTQCVRNALLAAVSHDYRTPLATILGAASSLQTQGERMTATQRERLAHTIVEETEQLGRLTDNTLQLARLEAPGLRLHLDWESAEEVVGAVLHRVRRRPGGERVNGRVEPDLPLLRCDALLLAQLLDNLVDNALRYSPPASPIEVLARQQDGQVVLAVRDRGPGVPAAWRDKVFEPFQRGPGIGADGARAGAGVGLAVCRAIARAHGGEMRVRRRAHGGCALECWLPVARQPAPPEAEVWS
ncbi:DUF4118 domain-containing protein [Ideonella sp. B7]|uniref:ATP-binding protein n=1 Tax=Ideonella benzenivorans TaxID=2831643 RepID=UPI001CED9DB0|nr:ATP-binding protein [Ideonella benzenivorans]MCA6218698.1 DUF4118 domain-containing protein [Ideonella benzenivorans]